MVESNKGTALAERSDESRSDDLPSLLERLGEDVVSLLDQKLALLKVEVREEVNAYMRGGLLILGGGVVAAVGFALANIALAFAVSTLFADLDITQPAKYALGFLVTGIGYLIAGSIVILIIKNRLAKQGIVPRRTVQELERDKDWLKNEL
ncbi:MAG TPA: phage holin family protein [Pyrinomonadaceae bacterium]|nr:phage holin family protein [Pyrinomonadaceae bacterium]